MHEKVDGEGIFTPIKFHDCTREDLKEIYVVSHESQHEWEQMVEDEDVRFQCIDEYTDDMLLSGHYMTDNYRTLEYLVVPCNFINTRYGETEDDIHPECIRDEKLQKEYLGSLTFKMVAHYTDVDISDLGPDPVRQKSRLIKQHIDLDTPTMM